KLADDVRNAAGDPHALHRLNESPALGGFGQADPVAQRLDDPADEPRHEITDHQHDDQRQHARRQADNLAERLLKAVDEDLTPCIDGFQIDCSKHETHLSLIMNLWPSRGPSKPRWHRLSVTCRKAYGASRERSPRSLSNFPVNAVPTRCTTPRR